MKANNIPENNFISYKKLKNTQLTSKFPLWADGAVERDGV